MSQRALTDRGRPDADASGKTADLAPTTLLELLDDEYARGILEATLSAAVAESVSSARVSD